MTAAEIAFLSAAETAERIRRRELSPVEHLEACVAQYEALNPIVNAVVTSAYDEARELARRAEQAVLRGDELGPLHGLTIGLKDITATAALRTTYGSSLFADYVPAEDALVVSRLKAAGGIIIGKTNTPEFAFGMNTTNALFGTTVNPWNTELTSGGSSGGSAVALATGMCALADGSDHGGSLRNPAAFCNVVGFRCSPGRVPSYPSSWVWDTFSVPGPMARTVRDTALMLSVMAGPDSRVPLSIAEPGAPFAEAAAGSVEGWRVAWTPDLNGLFPVDPQVAGLIERAAKRFADLGCAVEAASPDLSLAPECIKPLRTLRTAIVRQRQLDQADRIDNKSLQVYLARIPQTSAADVAKAEFQRSQIWDEVRRFFETYRLLLLPAVQRPAFSKEWPYPQEIAGQPVPDTLFGSLATYAITMTGLPAISIPCGFTSDGLPIGLQVVGGWRREADVLRAAAAFEAAQPWAHHRPPVVVQAIASVAQHAPNPQR